jgi:hypothetical protein
VRFFERLRESLSGDNEKADEENRGDRKTKRSEENSMQILDSRRDIQGGRSYNTGTMVNVKPSQILMVNQLWLWILDTGMSSWLFASAYFDLTVVPSRYHHY